MFKSASSSCRRLVASLVALVVLAIPVSAQLAPCCDPCFEGCHDHGMWWLEREGCDLACASAWFEWCMDEFCGGM